jgi:hypothetical protein
VPVTIDPAVEACQAIVARINSGTAYTLGREARYREFETTDLKAINDLEIDVVPQLDAPKFVTLDSEDPASCIITIWYRVKLASLDQEVIDDHKLAVRQIWQRVQNYSTSTVKVWNVEDDSEMSPNKDHLRRLSLFSAFLKLRVHVEASP